MRVRCRKRHLALYLARSSQQPWSSVARSQQPSRFGPAVLTRSHENHEICRGLVSRFGRASKFTKPLTSAPTTWRLSYLLQSAPNYTMAYQNPSQRQEQNLLRKASQRHDHRLGCTVAIALIFCCTLCIFSRIYSIHKWARMYLDPHA